MALWIAICLLTSEEEICERIGSHWVGVLLTVHVTILRAAIS